MASNGSRQPLPSVLTEWSAAWDIVGCKFRLTLCAGDVSQTTPLSSPSNERLPSHVELSPISNHGTPSRSVLSPASLPNSTPTQRCSPTPTPFPNPSCIFPRHNPTIAVRRPYCDHYRTLWFLLFEQISGGKLWLHSCWDTNAIEEGHVKEFWGCLQDTVDVLFIGDRDEGKE
ncbi:hypothetical protein GYMLUDRAFT_50688 [Collybiopsis luxurians FD-317 M1]|uniref:Uncharacterized protein n=1 Tax=Collybiopsis luxurians FD-317 M1 TaxID=944289 RepID=A0A0D0BAA9_9AGAR|nr:hypothetical protein GYMLUDRAFT_50688 [Collybiopsis luxurians FD-317 M1]